MLDAPWPPAANAVPEWLGFPGQLEQKQCRRGKALLRFAIAIMLWLGVLFAPNEQPDQRRSQGNKRRCRSNDADGFRNPGGRRLEVLQLNAHRAAVAFAFLDQPPFLFAYFG